MSLAKLTSKGQLTLPKTIREYLKVNTGDILEFVIDEKGKVMVTPKTVDIEHLYGIVKGKKHVTIEEMKKAVRQRAVKRHKNQ
jgi:AbrB family looped-hinge helix DNA binding protein